MISPPFVLAVAHAAAHSSSFHFDLGDLPTWATALIALCALIAAIAAYRKQSASDDNLAEQVRLQGEALKDQQRANALQARITERELRAESRRQAEQIDVEHAMYAAARVDDLISPCGMFWLVQLSNRSPRPVRGIACQLPAEYEEAVVKAAWFDPAEPEPGFGLVDNKVIPLIASEDSWGFVVAIPPETPQRVPGPLVRFTDDAGLHWQVTDDKSIAPVDERDW